MSQELGSAIELLRERLSPGLVRRLGRSRFVANLLDYLWARIKPRLLFSPENLQRIDQLSRELDQQEYQWERRIADEALAGRLYAASNPYCDRFLPVDRERFDFSRFEHEDPQAIHGLNRMRWLPSLARSYWADRDRRYFDALLREWDFFAAKVRPRTSEWMSGVHRMGIAPEPPFSELDSYIRLVNFWWAYWVILWASEMTGETNAILLARCLQAFDAAACRGIMLQEHNFTAMEMEAIYLWAASLPEVVGMDLWKHNARTNLQASLSRAVLPDGGQWEMSISYQMGCVAWYATPALMAARQGEAWPEAYVDRIVAMAGMADALVLPDLSTPALGDSDRVSDWRRALSLARALRPEARFGHPAAPTHASLWRTDGLTWDVGRTQPLAAAEVFRDTGLAILRTGSEAQAAMAIMKNSPRRPSHAHEDNLTVLFEAFGRPVIVDPGRWIYDRSADRAWAIGAVSHNVPWISGERLSAEDFDFSCSRGRSHERWFHLVDRTGGAFADVTVAAEQGAARYAGTAFRGFVADRAAEVRRHIWLSGDERQPWLVVLDEISGGAGHFWTNSFLLPADNPLEGQNGQWHGQLAEGLTLVLGLAVDGELALEQQAKFWCRNYATKEPAVWLRFGGLLHRGRRAFAFVPSVEGQREVRLELQERGVLLNVDGKSLQLALEE